MIVDRRNLLKALPVVATAALTNPSILAAPQASSVKLTLEPAGTPSFRPLQEATLHIAGRGWENGTIVVVDGAGREYLREKANTAFKFKIGGALGKQTARVLDKSGAIIGQLDLLVDCSTELNDEG